MKRRILSIALCLCMALTLLPAAAWAVDAPAFSGGEGTENDPWQIHSKDDLITLATFVNDGSAAEFDTDSYADPDEKIGNFHGYYFKQTADIDMAGVTWEPIGYSGEHYFAGNYDGGNYTVSNLTSTGKLDGDGYATAGLFGWVAFGSVSNVTVDSANLLATGTENYSYVGGIAAVVYGSTIENCTVTNSNIASKRTPNNSNCVGGIVGYSTGGTFKNCTSKNNEITTMCYGGGFVGEIDDDYGVGSSTFTACVAENCTITANSNDVQISTEIGGFAGEVTNCKLTITNCDVLLCQTVNRNTPQTITCQTGIFAGNLWNGSDLVDTGCRYATDEETPNNIGSAVKVVQLNGAAYKLDTTTDLAADGLNLDKENGGTLPIENTAYQAGDGYVLFAPAAGEGTTPNTLTLMNAEIVCTSSYGYLFQLPQTDVAIQLVGTNTLSGANNATYAFVQGYNTSATTVTVTGGTDSKLTIDGFGYGFNLANGALTIGGDAAVEITNAYYRGVTANALTVTGNASLTTDTVDSRGGLTVETTKSVTIPYVYMNFTTPGGTVTDNGKLNALVVNAGGSTSASTWSYIAYGNCTSAGVSEINRNSNGLTVSAGAKLTIPANKTLTVDAKTKGGGSAGGTTTVVGVPPITNNGTLENNGVLVLPNVYPEYNNFASMSAAIQALKLTGTGLVRVMDYTNPGSPVLTDTYYLNDGTKVVYRTTGLDFSETETNGTWSSTATVETDGYSYKSDGKGGYTLTLGDLYMNVAAAPKNSCIYLPSDGNISIVLTGMTTLNFATGVALCSDYSEENTPPYDVTISGSGTLNAATAGGWGKAAILLYGQKQNLVIAGGTVNAVGSTGIVAASGDLTISGGTVNATGTLVEGHALASYAGSISITGGTVTATTTAETGTQTTAFYVGENHEIKLTNVSIQTPTGADIGIYIARDQAGSPVPMLTVLNPDGTPAREVTIGRVVSDSSTTTNTTQNADGSTTTTVTDLATGTVTATTKRPDGSSAVVETKKDGTVTETIKDAAGNVTQTVNNPDGSSKTTATQTSGVTTVTNTTADGKTTAAVTVPQTVTGPVAVTIPADLGGQDGTVSAEITYPDGTSETVTGTYAGGQVSLTVSGSATIEILDDFVPLASALPFTDVPTGAWYYAELLYAYQNGLFAGTSATTFSPGANMTREQMWMVLARMAGKSPANMAQARTWAMESGVSDGTNPKDSITREQFVTSLWRFAGSPKATKDMSGYTDFDSVSEYAKEAMRWAVETGIIGGTTATTLSPTATATRAQVAAILARYHSK